MREIEIAEPEGRLPATLYTPVGLPEDTPLLVFFHGGGWVIGSLRHHDNAVRFLAKNAGVRVLSIDYRLAPEFPFPAAVDDALAAFEYAVAKRERPRRRPGADRRRRRQRGRQPRRGDSQQAVAAARPGAGVPAADLPGDGLRAAQPLAGSVRRGLVPDLTCT